MGKSARAYETVGVAVINRKDDGRMTSTGFSTAKIPRGLPLEPRPVFAKFRFTCGPNSPLMTALALHAPDRALNAPYLSKPHLPHLSSLAKVSPAFSPMVNAMLAVFAAILTGTTLRSAILREAMP